MGFWTSARVANILGLNLSQSSKDLHYITTDSRQVKPGSLFIAIKGDTHDGNQFIPEAIRAGALAVICEKNFVNEIQHSSSCEIFRVPSSLAAIRTLAEVYRTQFKFPIIAVIGAVGKTTTKEMIASMLSGKYLNIKKTHESENGFLGIPLTLLKLTPETDIAIIEIGIDELGAMEQHVDLVKPTHLILTRTGPEHLHQLKTLELAAREELKAFDYALTKNIPIAMNLDDPFVYSWFQKNQSKITENKSITYSLDPKLNSALLGTYLESENSLKTLGKLLQENFTLPLPGKHNAQNLLASIALSQFFNLDASQIRMGLSTFKTAKGRTHLHPLNDGIEIIADHYNSNPTSLEAALTLLFSSKNKDAYFAVLGDMLELGDEEEKFHRQIASQLIDHQVSEVWLYGERMKWLDNEIHKASQIKVHHFETHEALSNSLKLAIKPNTRILIKGSRGMKMEKILNALLPLKESI